jgi:hypothetical protein
MTRPEMAGVGMEECAGSQGLEVPLDVDKNKFFCRALRP